MELRNEIEKHATAINELLDEQNKKQLHLDALYNHVDHLQSTKADKEQMNQEIDVKANRKELDKKISQDKFNSTMGSIDQSVQDLMQKLVGHVSIIYKYIFIYIVKSLILENILPHILFISKLACVADDNWYI